MKQADHLRNIAIIAHVDHGKTTLVDQLFKQSGVFRENQVLDERLMDSLDLERERGITIAAKNCSIEWQGVKVNILDTPGHADFGAEVERSLRMVQGALLLVDAAEGPLPQTRFVLEKALQLGLSVLVVINKIDRPDARPDEVLEEIYELFLDCGASDAQFEFPLLYAIGKDGIAKRSLDQDSSTLAPLLDAILEEIPPPNYEEDTPFHMQVLNLSYSDFLGRLAIGRVLGGSITQGDSIIYRSPDGEERRSKVRRLEVYQGPQLVEAENASAGEIAVLAGAEEARVGDTVCTPGYEPELPRVVIEEPTVSMKFCFNNSPLGGKEGKFVQAAKLRDRLHRETLFNVALRLEEGAEPDSFLLKGRGELQMAILVENMRREGYELCVGRPEVILREKDGELYEPVERLIIDCDEEYVGAVTQKLSQRKGQMQVLHKREGSSRARIEFSLPSRALIGYRNEFLTDTRGTGIMSSSIERLDPYVGDLGMSRNGSLVSDRAGEAVAYSLFNLEARGTMFITPGETVYEGMVVGEYNRAGDLWVNPTKGKKLTNMRAAGKDENVTLTPVPAMTVERALEFLHEDELLEATPKSLRIRKIELKKPA